METTSAKIWTCEEIKEHLLSNDQWVARAILALYDRQTADEKVTKSTKVTNGKGFTSYDAPFGCYCGTWIKAGKPLTGKFLEKCRKMTSGRYLKQITDIANGIR